MSEKIPDLLVLELKFNVSDDVLAKNTFISLDIEKLKLEEVNKKREKNSKQLIEYGDIEKFIKRVSVNNENLEIVVSENKEGKDDPDVIEDLKSLFVVNKKSIQDEYLNRKVYLHYDESYRKNLVEDNEKLFDESYKTIYHNNVIKAVGEENYRSLRAKKSKYTPIFNTLTNENSKLLRNIYNDLKETDSFKFTDDDNLMIYFPDNSLIEIPCNIYGEFIDYESVDFTLRYPTEEEFNNNKICECIRESNTFNNILGRKILYKYSSESKEDWTKNNIINHNSSRINTGLYPRIVLDKDNNLTTTNPVEKREYYLRLFYGINKKLFDGTCLEEGVFQLSV